MNSTLRSGCRAEPAEGGYGGGGFENHALNLQPGNETRRWWLLLFQILFLSTILKFELNWLLILRKYVLFKYIC